jgi:hypothetical protein
MSERKIRLTLSSTIINNLGALIDVDFNGENLDVDVEVTAERGVSNLVKEYTVDVTSGTYNLDVTYKNDMADDLDNDGSLETDRNFIIEKIEIASNAIDYEPLLVNSTNSNLDSSNYNFHNKHNPDYNPDLPRTPENHPLLKNPNFDNSLPETDVQLEGGPPLIPGTNSWFLYELEILPLTIYTSSTATFQISFS